MVSTRDELYLVIRVAVRLYRTLAAHWCFRGAHPCPQLHHGLVKVPGSLWVNQCIG